MLQKNMNDPSKKNHFARNIRNSAVLQDDCSPKVAVIILNYNQPHLTTQCVETFLATEYPNLSIVIVDNGSTDNSVEILKKHFDLPLISVGINRGYSAGNNEGIKYALVQEVDYILIVNNDTEVVNKRFLYPLVEEMMQNRSTGIIGPKVLNPGEHVQKTILHTPTLTNYFCRKYIRKNSDTEYDVAHEVEAVSGVCWLVRSEIFLNIGLLDEDYFMYGEEQDYCYRVRQVGWKVKYLPVRSVLHKIDEINPKSIQLRYVYSRRNQTLFLRKHAGFIPGLVLALLLVSSSMAHIILSLLTEKNDQEQNNVLGNSFLLPLAKELMTVLIRSSMPNKAR
jgi:GT2 family glycosyltransferase